MGRQPLLRLLTDYCRRYPEEAAVCERMREFVEAHAECFERRLAKGHMTGSCWLIDASGDRVLLVHHRKLNRWLQPGGHADGDPDLLAVALREATEESGIEGIRAMDTALFDIDIHPIPERGDEAAHLHYDCRFLLCAPRGAEPVVGDESHDVRWVPHEELHRYTSEESVTRMARKWWRR